jgi:molybdate transport system ATP-binding protein
VTLRVEAAVTDRGVDVAFEVAAGETVALLGPNGAGKSTVLAVLAGLLRPDRGRVSLAGRELTRVDRPPVEGARARPPSIDVPPHDRQVSLLAQEPLLFPHLSVLENVAFGPRSAGAGRTAARRTAEHWLAEVGIADLADRRPARLSGGQAQRAAVARALAADPQLLLLDEPMAALDVEVAPFVRQMLRRVLADRTVVLVTHDALDALLLADRVLVVEDGRIIEQGPSADVLAQPRNPFTAQLAGLNMVAGTWRAGALETASGMRLEGGVSEPAPQEAAPVVAAFAPQAVSVFLAAPGGSPRNAVEAVVTQLEPYAGRVRVRSSELSADITPQAAADLDLAPGSRVHFVVKATEVVVHTR